MAEFIVKTIEENDSLTVFLKGEINSTTSPKVETEVMDELKKHSFKSLNLNFAQISYVSSAGLRFILKLKKLYNDVSILDASLSVYDVFSMTGFTNIMTVKKALLSIDVTGCEVIGEGYFSIVYRIDKDTIVKVYRHDVDISAVEKELNMAKQAFILGIPTAISFDVVKIKDKLGVRFEMLDAISLRDLFRDNPNRFDELLDKYVDLLKKINGTEAFDDSLPYAKDSWLKKLDNIKGFLPQDKYEKSKSLLETIPQSDTFVHGDCQFKNIMVQNGEFLFIDMDTLSKGDPIFELAAGIFVPYLAFEEDSPGNNQSFLGISSELSSRIAHGVIEKYYDSKDPAVLDKIKIVSYIHFLWWNKANEPENEARFERLKGRLFPLLDKYDDLLIR